MELTNIVETQNKNSSSTKSPVKLSSDSYLDHLYHFYLENEPKIKAYNDGIPFISLRLTN